MATTGKVRSNLINIYISNDLDGTLDDTGSDDTFDIIASSTSGTFSGELETIDATSKDNDGARSILVSAINWNISAEGLVQFDDTTNKVRSAELFDIWKAKTQIRVAWTTGESGDNFYFGNGYITSYEESAGLNEVASYSITIEGDGDINKTATATATFNS